MAALPLPTTVNPSRASSRKVNARILESNFGDGYSQRAGDGLNSIRDEWSVSWPCLDSTAYTEYSAFFEERAGYQAILWTPPGESTQKKFICKEWNVGHIGNSKYTISATFMEVFDLS